MNDVSIRSFQFQAAAGMRAVMMEGEPWFVATDVADILGYRNAPDMVRNLDDDEAATHILRSSGQGREMLIISESGLYHAIFSSRRAEAQRFRKWVTSDVLPAIRRTGSYASPQQEDQIAALLAGLPKQPNGKRPDPANLAGITRFIEGHPHLAGRMSWDALRGRPAVDGHTIEPENISEFRYVMHSEDFMAGKGKTRDAMILAAQRTLNSQGASRLLS